MTPMTERIRAALAFAVSEMPNAAAQQKLANSVEESRKDDETETRIICALAGAVIDGHRYGNWPA